jgi:hypothetical protein
VELHVSSFLCTAQWPYRCRWVVFCRGSPQHRKAQNKSESRKENYTGMHNIWNSPGSMCSPAATWATSTDRLNVIFDRLNVINISSGSMHPCLSEVYPTTT